MIRMLKCLVSCQGYFANIVTSKLPQLTVLVRVGRLVMCHVMKELSPDWFLMQMACYGINWITHSHHLQNKCKWVDKASFRKQTFSPFAFGHG